MYGNRDHLESLEMLSHCSKNSPQFSRHFSQHCTRREYVTVVEVQFIVLQLCMHGFLSYVIFVVLDSCDLLRA